MTKFRIVPRFRVAIVALTAAILTMPAMPIMAAQSSGGGGGASTDTMMTCVLWCSHHSKNGSDYKQCSTQCRATGTHKVVQSSGTTSVKPPKPVIGGADPHLGNAVGGCSVPALCSHLLRHR